MCFSVVKRRFTKRCEKKDVPAGRNRLRMILLPRMEWEWWKLY